MARSRCGGRSRGAQESRSKTGHSNTDSDLKIQSDTTTTISVLHDKDVCVCDMSCCITSIDCCGMPNVFCGSIGYISPAYFVVVDLLQAAAAHCEFIFGDPVALSCLWLIDARPIMRVSAPGARLFAALLLYAVNPSCLWHFRL